MEKINRIELTFQHCSSKQLSKSSRRPPRPAPSKAARKSKNESNPINSQFIIDSTLRGPAKNDVTSLGSHQVAAPAGFSGLVSMLENFFVFVTDKEGNKLEGLSLARLASQESFSQLSYEVAQ
jgi:hypothetical protein